MVRRGWGCLRERGEGKWLKGESEAVLSGGLL